VFSYYFTNRDGHVYFEISSLLITFVILGKMLEAITKGKASDAIKKLMMLQPKTAIVLREGKEIEVGIDEVNIGDVVIIKPGQRIPVDGIVISGESSVDESMLTGESMPVDKKKGNKVIGGTINKQGTLKVKAERIGKDSFLNQIIKLVEEAQSSKAPMQRLADRISAVFVPTVLLIALTSFVCLVFFCRERLGFCYNDFCVSVDNSMSLRFRFGYTNCYNGWFWKSG
jgi:Cu+-exporting ATPase